MLDVALLRVDSRLLHGQVATSWIRNLKIKRVLVVSDSVAQDTLRKSLIQQVAPSGVKVNVIPVQKAIRINRDERFDELRVLILVENLLDAKRLIQGGVKVSEINIGMLPYSSGKTMITNSVSIDKQDIQNISFLHRQGILFDTRQVITDRKRDLWRFLVEQDMAKSDSME